MIKFILILAAYLLLAQLGSQITLSQSYISLIWPAAGMAIGALYVYGIRYAPAIFLASFIHLVILYKDYQDVNVLTSLAISISVTVQSIIGKMLLWQLYEKRAAHGNLKDMMVFFLFVGPLPCLISSIIGPYTLMLSGIIEGHLLLDSILSWYLGNLFGALILTPLFIITFQSMLQGKEVPLKQRLTVVVPVITSLLIFVLVLNNQKQQATEQSFLNFQTSSSSEFDRFRKLIILNTAAINSVAAYLNSVSDVDSSNFSTFTNNILKNTVGIYGISYLAKVTHSERPNFVEAIRKEGFPNYDIYSRNSFGELSVSGENEIYFPLTYTEPYEKNQNAHGFDVYGRDEFLEENIRRKVLDNARDTGHMQATKKFSIVQKNDEYGFIVYLPLYDLDAPETIEEKRKSLIGYVNGIFTMPGLFNSLETTSSKDAFDFILYDVSEEERVLLYDSRTPDFKEGDPSSYEFSEDAIKTEGINFAGRDWELVFINNEGILSKESISNLKLLISVGMVLNVIFMILLIVIVSRTEYAETLAQVKNRHLAKQRDLLKAAEEEAKIGHWSYNLKTEEIFWSDQTYKIHRLNASEFTPELETALDFYHPDDQSRVSSALEDSIKTKKPFRIQARIITHCGKEIDIISSGRAELNSDGKVISLFGTFQDISEIINIENKLLETQQHYKLAAEGANIGLWDWNVITDEVYFNEQWYKMLGYEPYELPPEFNTFQSLCHPDDAKDTINMLKSHMKGETKNYQKHVRMKHKEGHWLSIMTSGQVMKRDEDGKATRVSGIHLDISDRVKNETQLLQANAELEEFAYRTSHDLRSPLLSSFGLLQIVSEAVIKDDKNIALESINHIQSSIQKLLSLIEDLLILAETKNSDEQEQEIDVTEAIEIALGKLQHYDGFNEVMLKKSLKFNQKIITKKMRFNLILENLISNAIKYRDTNKKENFIKISTYKYENKFVLEVEDNGLGIPSDKSEKLFGMFERFHPKVAHGSGLGLYMIKKSADIINGQIKYKDTKDGSCFKLLLNLVE